MDDETNEEAFQIVTIEDRWWLAARAMRAAADMGFGASERACVGICAAELASNVVKFAGRGVMRLGRVTTPHVGIVIVAEDDGPGITDVGLAMRDGYSEGLWRGPDVSHRVRRGLGTGLGTLARLASAVEIRSRERGGMRIEVRLQRVGPEGSCNNEHRVRRKP
jgi:anti-sigma regulatory factor (Ser/Thr protein kinase)